MVRDLSTLYGRTPPVLGMRHRLAPGAQPRAHGRSAVRLLAACLVFAAVGVAQDWPQFRGPARDGVFPGRSTIEAFPAEGPELVWERSIGAGFSAPVAAGGRLVVFHRLGNQEVVEALRTEDGSGLWKFAYETAYRDDFGFDNGPRATPVIADGRVYTFGAQGWLHCLDFETGRKIWGVDTHKEFGVRKGFFGAASTPLVADGRVLVNVGGSGAGIVAFDAATGEVLWKATEHEASYSSPVMARLDGEAVAVFFTREGLAVVKPASGEVTYQRRWRSRTNASVNAATPLVDGEVVLLSASYGTGSIAMKLCNREVDVLWSGEGVIDSHYSSSVLSAGTVYGFHGRQEYGQSFRAADLKTGEVLWSHDGIRAGSVSRVGDRLLLLLESGELVMAVASPESFEVVSRAQVLARETRAFPAVAGGSLFARDIDTLICLRLWSE